MKGSDLSGPVKIKNATKLHKLRASLNMRITGIKLGYSTYFAFGISEQCGIGDVIRKLQL